MKQVLIFLICIYVAPCFAAVQIVSAKNDGLDSLRGEINRLEKQLAQKTDALNKCASKNKNFQIAGIATVGLATAGVVTNVSLYSKMKDQKKQAENMNNKIRTADAQMQNLLIEMDQLKKNLDEEKFVQELHAQLTDAEIQRFLEIGGGKVDENSLTESDFVILGKMVRAMRASQK